MLRTNEIILKRQANILSSLITNFQTVEDVIATSSDSAGSAMKENAKWMDSIEGKTTQLTNAMQTLWNDTLNSDVIKYFLDLALGITKVVDKVGLLGTALAGIMVYLAAFKKITPAGLFKDISMQVKNYNAAISQLQTLKSVTGVTSGMSMTAFSAGPVQAYAAAVSSLTAKQQASALATAGLTKAQIAQVMSLNGVKDATIQQVLGEQQLAASKQATTAITAEEAAAMVANNELKLSDAAAAWLAEKATGALTREKILSAVASGALKGATMEDIAALLSLAGASDTAKFSLQGLWGVMKANPIGWIMMAVTAVISIVTAIKRKKDEAIQATNQTISKYQEETKALQEQKATIDELSKSYSSLSSGVDVNTNKNINLSTSAYQEYLDTCNEIADMYPELVVGFDAQGNAILSLKGNVDQLTEAYNNAAQAARQQMIASGDDVFNLFKDTYNKDTYGWDREASLSTQLKIATQLQEVLATGDTDQVQTVYDKLYNTDMDMLYATLEAAGIKLKDFRDVWGNVKPDNFRQISGQLLSLIQSTTTKINAETSKVKSLLDAYLGEDLNYATLDDETKNTVDGIISNLNAEFIHGFDSSADLWNWIKTNVVDPFSDPSIGKDISKNISNIFDLQSQFKSGEIDLGSYQEQILSLVNTIRNSGLNEKLQDQILQMFNIDFENTKSIGSEIDQMLTYAQSVVDEATKDKVLQLSYSDLQIINSEQFEVPSGVILSWDELQAKIKETKIAMTEDFTTDNFANYTESINAIQESISTYQEALEKLDSGTFTMSDFIELIEEFPDLAKDVDVSSKSFNGLSQNLRKAMRSSPDDLVNELENLKKQLIAAGKSTTYIDQLIDSIESMPEDAVRSMTDEYITLADAMNEAKVAQNELQAAMEENPNEGYETRGEAIEKMISLMEKGIIGSESELWSIAKAYGFTYDSAKSINENADALASFIAVRQRWYKTDDDGNYTFEGTENFIKDVEKVIDSNSQAASELKNLGVEWSYIDGALNIDFNNADWDEVVRVLSTTEELAGLTSEEFADMMVQIGQFFGIDWENQDDILEYLNGIVEGTDTGTEKLRKYGEAMQQAFGQNATVDLTNRPMVSAADMQMAGWTTFQGDYATTYSQTYTNEDGTQSIVVTPILENGEVLSPEALDNYAQQILNGEELDPGVNILLGEFNGENAEEEANKFASALSEAQAQYDTLRSLLEIETTINNDGLDGLREISELQGTISEESHGITVIDTDAFRSVLEEAGYTEQQIDELLAKIREYNNLCEVTNEDPLGLNNADSTISSTAAALSALDISYYETKASMEGDPISLNINATDLITTLQNKGWTKEQIVTYLQTLSSQTGITIDGQVNMTTDQIDEAITKANEVPETETTQYSVTGTGLTDLKSIDNYWATKVPAIKSTKYSIYQTTYKDTVDNSADALNGTAHASGTAHARGSWGAPRTETALVGELGPELLVRGSRWTTIGDNGAEFTQIKKGDIIFNHKQTEDLLSKGYITGRGKAYVSGTAYLQSSGAHTTYNFDGNGSWTSSTSNALNNTADNLSNAADNLSNAASAVSDSADEFREVFDWIEVRISEINEKLDLKAAQLENAVGRSAQNAIVNDMIDINETLYNNLAAGLNEYSNYASTLLAKIPAEYQEAAQNGAIAIEEFVGEANEETLEAIQNYRDWSDKVAELQVQMEELVSTIAELAKQRFDNISEEFENIISLFEGVEDRINAMISLVEESGYVASNLFYEEMTTSAQEQIAQLTQQLTELQNSLAQAIANNEIQIGSEEWYEMVQEIQDVGTAIIEAQTAVEEYQNAINDIYWDNFDNLINQFGYLSEETQNMIDLLSHEDLVDEFGNWTDEGIASMGLYAQQMEIAEYQANQYAQAIADLNRDYAAGRYSESEYLEKLNELQSAQYDSIEAYHEAQEAIVDLNEARVDAIKEGIEKEIDAYQELISKKKEELDAEKDLYDFQKSVMEQQKDITDIERKLAALSNDQSASAMAKRRQLEAELAEAKAELEETYYDRSVDQQQEAYDKEAETFEEEKNAEIKKWEEYLENIEQVVADSLLTVQENATGVYNTLSATASEYGVTLSDAILTPWESGINAISNYQEVFDTASSETLSQLERIYSAWLDNIELANTFAEVSMYGSNASPYGTTESINNATNPQTQTTTTTTTTTNNNTDSAPAPPAIAVGGKINAGSASIYANSNGGGGSRQYFASDPIYTVLEEKNGYLKVRWHKLSSGVTGWFKKSDVKALAIGTTNLKKSGIVNIDELGEELVLRAKNGRLTYMEKGSGVIPADLTSNLMSWGKLNPQDMLDRNRPSIGVSPEINHTEISIDQSIGELIHIDNCSTETLPDVKKIVNEALEKHTQRLNQSLRKYTR